MDPAIEPMRDWKAEAHNWEARFRLLRKVSKFHIKKAEGQRLATERRVRSLVVAKDMLVKENEELRAEIAGLKAGQSQS